MRTSSIQNTSQVKQQKVQQRGKIENCEICEIKFTSLRHKEHKCKRCLRSICSKCGDKKKPIVGFGQGQPEVHRICDICLKESNLIDQMIANESVVWGRNSNKTEEWKKILGMNQTDNQIQIEYSQKKHLKPDQFQTTQINLLNSQLDIEVGLYYFNFQFLIYIFNLLFIFL
ncbi:Zinc finger, FYVE/PHD-type [Pseudocohnilembus persalinus]|uniref:Zinc finger, FYVE/PHD-type n=1 Tax=Pseudocohnilembus persalinus TaxID=266149 RepID=A0A0V0QYU2_PSEPJ|nr:Zinc finger, FYVE/PHD-type [Pseudocohnilembus persalinus]|eukprot:KRX07064.1 Zinc finger, FYVE/PHD-type [Pseudocohnilembus persalinus]